MGDFAPSVETAKKALGDAVPIDAKPHPPGGAGVKFSLDEVARRAARGRNDPLLRSWATRAIHDAGGPQDMVDQARAILKALKAQTSYVQDPLNTEFMVQPRQLLCLDERGLCFKASDCDDLTIAFASATMSVGIPTKIVAQSFDNGGVPQHVLAAIQDPRSKEWLRVDPSTNKQVGDYQPANQEWWVDPLDPNDKTSSTITGSGDFVGVGHLNMTSRSEVEGLGTCIHCGMEGCDGEGCRLQTRPRYRWLGDTPLSADAVVQQVQSILYGLQSGANQLQQQVAQLDQIKSVIGYDPEPATPIDGLSQFPQDGTWTQSMSNVCKNYISQADFLGGTLQDALNGAREIVVDAASNEIGIGSLASDPYTWKTVLATAVDAIIGIFSPAGMLLVGLTAAAGEVLSPAQVQSAQSSGTISGVPSSELDRGSRGVGAVPMIAWVALAGAALVVTGAIIYAYIKQTEASVILAKQATQQALVKYYEQMVSSGKMSSTQASTALQQGLQEIANTQATQGGTPDPFNAALGSVESLVGWLVVGGAVVAAVYFGAPLLKELGSASAEAVHRRRLHAGSSS